DYWVGRPNDAAYRALQEAGYQDRGVYVPHSNDGGAWMSENFESPRKQAAESKRIRAEVDAALERLKPFDKEAHFAKATGTQEGHGHQVGKGREEEIGSYGYNNGTLAFVDENGDYWVGRPNDAAYRALQEAGYQDRGVYVPHSNDGGAWMSENFERRNK
ncbi:MAG: hypothetical protein QF858_00610, partial [Candidatus Pacebacteria bacterium]|nr:hypothetical protein [Candidatus Paceibacterota bacterium]